MRSRAAEGRVAAAGRGNRRAHGLTGETTILDGFPVTICDPRAVALGEGVARDLFGSEAFRRLPDPIMGAEDFAYVLEKVPGAMFFLGVARKARTGSTAAASIPPA